MRKAILVSFACCLIIAPVWATAAQASKPNMIVVFTDDQGWADLGCQRAVDDVQTPHIDRLGREGVRMTSGYITAPQCVPSRAGIITGSYQQRFGVDHNGLGPLPLDTETLPAKLEKAGYVTGMVGKWHLDPNPTCSEWIAKHLPGLQNRRRRNLPIPAQLSQPYQPGQRGFTEFFTGQMADYRANFGLDGSSLAKKGESFHTELYRLDAQSDAAVSFIRRNQQQPFFLYLAYFAPHVPLDATETYLSRFPGPMPERRRYALAMISAMDDGVGRILDELATLGIDENTLIFFISDNGAPLKIDMQDLPISMKGGAWDGSRNDPWIGEKGMLTEGGIRVPYLVRWKGTLPEALVYDEPVISLDVAATALDVAGVGVPNDSDGVSLIPYLTGVKSESPHEDLFWRFWGQAAIRSGKWKYLHLADGREFLFDLSSDEHETRNLLRDHISIANTLKKRLEDWASRLKRPGLPTGALNSQEIKWYEHYLPE